MTAFAPGDVSLEVRALVNAQLGSIRDELSSGITDFIYTDPSGHSRMYSETTNVIFPHKLSHKALVQLPGAISYIEWVFHLPITGELEGLHHNFGYRYHQVYKNVWNGEFIKALDNRDVDAKIGVPEDATYSPIVRSALEVIAREGDIEFCRYIMKTWPEICSHFNLIVGAGANGNRDMVFELISGHLEFIPKASSNNLYIVAMFGALCGGHRDLMDELRDLVEPVTDHEISAEIPRIFGSIDLSDPDLLYYFLTDPKYEMFRTQSDGMSEIVKLLRIYASTTILSKVVELAPTLKDDLESPGHSTGYWVSIDLCNWIAAQNSKSWIEQNIEFIVNSAIYINSMKLLNFCLEKGWSDWKDSIGEVLSRDVINMRMYKLFIQHSHLYEYSMYCLLHAVFCGDGASIETVNFAKTLPTYRYLKSLGVEDPDAVTDFEYGAISEEKLMDEINVYFRNPDYDEYSSDY